jgi:alkylation response protein AidB-like acyl-CoA dehydrogenase
VNFDFSDDQRLLQHTAREVLAEHAPLARCREVLESDAPYSKALWERIAQLGWLGTAVPEAYGGAGFGPLEQALLAEELGRALAPVPFASSALVADALALAGTEAQKRRWLPRLAEGTALGAFALGGGPDRDGADVAAASLSPGGLRGQVGSVLDGGAADLALLLVHGNAGPTLALVDLHGPGVAREPLRSIDPSRKAARLRFDGAAAEALGAPGEGALLAERLLDRAAVIGAFEQLGGAERALEATKAFTLGRYAFGRPIASFQALKHRLADLWVEIELARSNAWFGAWALASGAPDLPVAAAAAQVAASGAFELAATEMIQMHGGVGYTWEYDCHLFYRRAKTLSLALGGPAHWKDLLVARLEARSVRQAA